MLFKPAQQIARPLILRLLCCGLWLTGPCVAAAQDIDIPIPEARALATEAALSGDAETGRALAAALLQANPNDRTALLVLAIVEPQLGRPAQGRLAGARAYAVSVTNAEKYEAARLTALAAANEGRFTLAQWWLRRALTVAPTPADAAQTTADARGLRNLNPWSTNLALSFAPSGNVNGGATNEFNGIDGEVVSERLSPGDRALSGWAGTIDISTRFRLAASQFYQTSISARAYVRGVLLSENARDFIARESRPSDPAVKNSDYSTALLEFGLRHDRAATNGTYGFSLNLGQAWSKTDFDYTFLRIGADRRLAVSDAIDLSFAGSLEQRWDDDDDPNEWRYSLQGRLGRTLGNADVVSASLAYSGIETDAKNAASTTTTLQIGYRLARRIGPAEIELSVGLQNQAFPVFYSFSFISGFFPIDGGRDDTRVFGSLDLYFPDYSYAGFAPVVTISAGRTDSNVGRFDRDDASVSFAFRSTF